MRTEVARIHVGKRCFDVSEAQAVRAGDLLYCSALWPLDPSSGRVVGGGVVEQAAQVYRNAVTVLAEAGFEMRDVVRTVEFIRASALPDYKDTWRVRAEHLGAPGRAAVAATGIPMSSLALDGALIQIEFTAVKGGGTVINPGWRRYERLTYAPAVRAGDFVFLSGQLAQEPESGDLVAPGDFAGQARYIYTNVERVLQAAGLGLDAIVKTTEYITPAARVAYGEVEAVRRELFGESCPAVTSVGCSELLRAGALIEIDGVAGVSSPRLSPPLSMRRMERGLPQGGC